MPPAPDDPRDPLAPYGERQARRGRFGLVGRPPAAGPRPRRRAILAAAALVTLAFSALLLSWPARAPEGLHLSGFYQGDMLTYVCYARMTQRSATTLGYASPHDVRDDAPPLLVNLPISAMGWLLSAGVPAGAVGHVFRLVFGVLMLFALGAYLRVVFPRRRWFWPAFVLVGLGGGVAWVAALWALPEDLAEGQTLDWLAGEVRSLENAYYWWFLDVFRNLTYPLEAVYHALVFGQLWALGTGRHRPALAFHALGCLSNPFVGIQMSGVQLAVLGLEALPKGRARARRAFAASAAIAFAFVVHYALVLPTDPAIASLQAQHADTLAEPLGLEELLLGYGPALLGPLALLLDRPFGRHVFTAQRALVPAAVLALWTAALAQNSRLPFDQQLMPLHFTRGYFHAGAWILTLAWLRHLAGRAPRFARLAPPLAAALALLLLPDNLFYARARYAELPQQPHLAWGDDQEAVLAWLRAAPPDRHVVAMDEALGRLVCALTPHRSAFGTALTTPHHFARREQMEGFQGAGEEPPLVAWADVLVLARHDGRRRALVEGGAWEEALCAGRLCVLERRGARRPAADSVPTASTPAR